MAKYVDAKIPENPQSYYQGFFDLIDQLIVQHDQVTLQLHTHLEAKNSILLNPEYETSKHLVDTFQQDEKESTKNHNVLRNWNVHYGEVYQQLTKSRDTLSELYNFQKTSTNDLLQQQLEQQISMERKHIDQLQEKEN